MPWINLTALWKIIVFGAIAGVGLPAIFAFGMTSLAHTTHRVGAGAAALAGGPAAAGRRASDRLVGNSPVGAFVAVTCFLVVLAAIGWSVYEIYTLGHPH